MKCLHCGVELALLKKLTGGAEFCSEEHRAAYFEEYSRLALDRLFEAHEDANPVSVAPAPKPEPPSQQSPPPAQPEPEPAPTAAEFLIEHSLAGLAAEPRCYAQEPLTEARQYLFPHADLSAADALPVVGRSEPVAVAEPPSRSGSLYGRLQRKGLVGRPPAKHAAPPPRYRTATRPPLRDVLEWTLSDIRCRPQTYAAPALDFSSEPEWTGLIQLHLAITGFDFGAGATLDKRAEPQPAVSGPAPEPEPPAVLENPLPLQLECKPGGDHLRDLTFDVLPYGPQRVHLPGIALSTLAPRIAFGPRPASPEEAPKATGTTKTAILPGNPTKPGHPAIAGRPPSNVPAAPKQESRAPAPAPDQRTAQPPQPPPAEKAPEKAAEIPVTFDVPNLAVTSGGFLSSIPGWVKAVALAAILGGGGYAVWNSSSGASKRTQAASRSTGSGAAAMAVAMGGGGWTVEQAADEAGEALGRQLRLYKPTLTMRDYVIEFSGRIQERALGWVFRVADTRNYYVMKLEAVRGGAGEVKLIRYAVVAGEEQTHTTVNLPFPARIDTVYRVRVDVKGPKFTTSVQGRPVDFWTDSQLLSGGIGFLNDREERAKIDSVQISF